MSRLLHERSRKGDRWNARLFNTARLPGSTGQPVVAPDLKSIVIETANVFFLLAVMCFRKELKAVDVNFPIANLCWLLGSKMLSKASSCGALTKSPLSNWQTWLFEKVLSRTWVNGLEKLTKHHWEDKTSVNLLYVSTAKAGGLRTFQRLKPDGGFVVLNLVWIKMIFFLRYSLFTLVILLKFHQIVQSSCVTNMLGDLK